jgi:hypothetical protein
MAAPLQKSGEDVTYDKGSLGSKQRHLHHEKVYHCLNDAPRCQRFTFLAAQ